MNDTTSSALHKAGKHTPGLWFLAFTLKPKVVTSYVLEPNVFPFVRFMRLAGENSGQLQYEAVVETEGNAATIEAALNNDSRILHFSLFEQTLKRSVDL